MPRFHSVICAIARNEAKYIIEWIAYHKVIGIDHIYLYNNDSEDETVEASREFESAGFVSWTNWPSQGRSNPQREAYQHFASSHLENADWLIFLDLDEYINLKVNVSIREFLTSCDSANAVSLNWRMFGSSAQQGYEPKLLVERFRRASKLDFPANRQVKTFVRSSALEAIDIHIPKLAPGLFPVTPSGRPVEPFPNVSSDIAEHDVAQVNHYFVKSRAEWAAKRLRGKADVAEGQPGRLRPDTEFGVYDRNEELDETILKFESALVATMRIHANPRFLSQFYGL